MGGTFDPIHIGHLAAASEVMVERQLDEVVFVPAGRPAHKLDRVVASGEDRHAMTCLAVASNHRFTVSRVDVDRPKPTITYDTLNDIRAERGADVELFFITGADSLATIMEWDYAEELFELAHFVGVSRSGHHLDTAGLPADRVSTVLLPELAMSSTEIRRRIRENLAVWYWLPETVIVHIGKRGLYGAQWGYGTTRGYKDASR